MRPVCALLFAALLVPGCLAVLPGCGQHDSVPVPVAPDGPEWFRDVTTEAKLAFQHDAGPLGSYFMPQIMGSGAAFLDVDGDGRLDVYLLQNAGPAARARHQLFRQRSNGTFENISAGSGLDIPSYGMGVAVGDIDNDGCVDLYVSGYGGGRLFRNRGIGPGGRWLGFEDVTATGVEQPRWGTSCAFLDFDRDAWLDLIVVNYVDYDPSKPCGPASGKPDYCHPSVFPGTAARLFRNRGCDETGKWLGFVDVTVTAGLAKHPGPGLGVACADFDGDSWQDILAANDARANHLWINNRDGVFREEGLLRGLACNVLGQPQANMGVALGDVDGDKLFDVFITHLTEEQHTLWRQEPRGNYHDQTAAAGLATPTWRGTGFGTVLLDFDHDGALDLAIANGRVARGATAQCDLPAHWRPYAERNQLFAGDGRGKFRDVSEANPALSAQPGVHRALAWGDYNNDGAIDLLVTAVAGPARLLRNVAPRRGHWLMVRAIDGERKRDAIGAQVTVRTPKRTFVGLVCPAQSYLSSGDMRVHFGLGEIDTIAQLRVDWPDGTAEEFPPPSLDRHVTVVRGKGRKVKP